MYYYYINIYKLYKDKKWKHKRIFEVGMIIKVPLQLLKIVKKYVYYLSNKYYRFLFIFRCF